MMDRAKLLQELKRDKLFITWEDEELDIRLYSLIDDAKHALDFKLGAYIDYSLPGMEHRLFLNYCMYDYNNCLADFDKNYLCDIYQIRMKYEVEQRRAKNEEY